MSDENDVIHWLEVRIAEQGARIAEQGARIAQLEAERQSRSRLPIRLSRRLAVGLLALIALAAPAVVLASHQFSDVSDANSFHDDIDWLADYGITGGFNDGTYRPSDPVTRGQMARFLHRLSNEFEVVSDTTDPGFANGFELQVPCPGDKQALAGGGFLGGVGDVYLTHSYPVLEGAWLLRWEVDDNLLTNPSSVTGFALCAPRCRAGRVTRQRASLG